jgi:hypothetical protein
VLGGVLVGERQPDLALVARRGALELLLEAGDEPARAELDHLVAARAALEGLVLAGERADVVHDDEVALLGGALDGLQASGALAQALDLAVDRGLVDLRLAAADLDALVVAELGRRAHADLDREGQRLALGGQVAEVDARVADRGDPRVADRVDVPAADRVAHGLVEHGLAPDAADDDRRRDLALAEAGDAHARAELARGALDAALDLVGRHLGVDADARLRQLGDLRLDGGGHGSADDTVRPVERLATWLVTGPVGHLVGGTMDWAELLARYWWARARGADPRV